MALKLRQRLAEVRRSDEQVAAEERREAASAQGCSLAAEVRDRQVVSLAGTVLSVTLRPRAETAALVAELDDGSSVVHLVWLGRRSIPGIDPGTSLRATGRLCHKGETPVIFNPAYELLAGGRPG